jgi:hypothetical protein
MGAIMTMLLFKNLLVQLFVFEGKLFVGKEMRDEKTICPRGAGSLMNDRLASLQAITTMRPHRKIVLTAAPLWVLRERGPLARSKVCYKMSSMVCAHVQVPHGGMA